MSAGTDGLPPRAMVSQMATGYWTSQAVRAMAVLGLADHLAGGPRTAEDLAEATGAHAPSLARLLRALVALGLCERDDAGGVRLSPLGQALRSDVPDSARAFVLMITSPWVERGWEELPHAVRTGETTFARVHGTGFWDYLVAHPEEGALFDAAMSGGAFARAEAILAACNLSSVGAVVDVGGGQGRLLATLLAAIPDLSGVLFDRPEVVAGADEVLRAAGVADRCEIVGGDFFTAVPPGRDAYVLAQIVHDWPEREALAILRACHRAMAPSARLWVIEQVLPPEEGSAPSERANLTLLDLNMLVLFGGGQERTAEEYQELMGAAGFGEVTVLPTGTVWSVVEAVRR
jgi:O-methyltransferase domain/Dimerisation domain